MKAMKDNSENSQVIEKPLDAVTDTDIQVALEENAFVKHYEA